VCDCLPLQKLRPGFEAPRDRWSTRRSASDCAASCVVCRLAYPESARQWIERVKTTFRHEDARAETSPRPNGAPARRLRRQRHRRPRRQPAEWQEIPTLAATSPPPSRCAVPIPTAKPTTAPEGVQPSGLRQDRDQRRARRRTRPAESPSAGSRHGPSSNTNACGAEGIRTPDPLHAMEVRYQLRHSPWAMRNRAAGTPDYSRPSPATAPPTANSRAAARASTSRSTHGIAGQSFHSRSRA